MVTSRNAHAELRRNTPVIDYEGSGYKTDFWEGRGRDYEDAAERLALQKLLPPRGPRLAEIGAGFGRLANLYLGYEQIILFDYSRSLLQDAVAHWGHDPRFIFVAGNLYELPLATGSLDTLVMVRVMHHLADVSQALRHIQRVLHRHSVAILEYANKRNAKAILRWLAGRQTWSPFAQAPVEFVPLNFDFHPAWMTQHLAEAQLSIRQQLAVSHLRLPGLKAYFKADTLAKIDSYLFQLGEYLPVSPSIFVQVETPQTRVRQPAGVGPLALSQLFCCPHCSTETLELVATEQLSCQQCGRTYEQRGGIWDFKEAVEKR